MKLTRSAAIALSVTALAAVGAPLAAHAATAHVATPVAAHVATHVAAPAARPAVTRSVAVYNCGNKPVVEPKTFVFTCDSTGYLAKLAWSTWNASTATATGVLYTDNCEPNCASGKWTHQNADVVLWRSEAVKGTSGQRGYTEMTFLLPSQRKTETRVPPGAFPGES